MPGGFTVISLFPSQPGAAEVCKWKVAAWNRSGGLNVIYGCNILPANYIS